MPYATRNKPHRDRLLMLQSTCLTLLGQCLGQGCLQDPWSVGLFRVGTQAGTQAGTQKGSQAGTKFYSEKDDAEEEDVAILSKSLTYNFFFQSASSVPHLPKFIQITDPSIYSSCPYQFTTDAFSDLIKQLHLICQWQFMTISERGILKTSLLYIENFTLCF